MELIDKQAAIDAINKAFARVFKRGGEESLGETVLKDVPSVADVPETNVGTKLSTNLAEVGTDCISRQAVMLRVREFIGNPSYTEKMLVDELNGLPPAQPEIIYCKDCKHWIPYDWMFREVWQSKNIADYPEDEIGCNWCEAAMKANDFCSHAERRQDG